MNFFLIHSYCFPLKWLSFSFFLSYSDVFYRITIGVVSNSHTHTHTVRLLWTRDRPVAETAIWQHTIFTINRHPCHRRVSNPQSQQASGHRRTARQPGSGWSASHALNCMYYLHFVGQSTQSALLTPIYHIATAFVCTMSDFVLLLFWHYSSALQTMISIPLVVSG